MAGVTIAIPTLLGGPTLYGCLKSLCRQTFRDFEVTLVNNGGGERIEDAPQINFPLRIISPGSNIGFGAAINLAVKNSSSDFIATLNDDTEADEKWLERLVAAMNSSPRVGMCAS